MASPFNAVEELILWGMGKIVCGVGAVGFVVSLCFDYIARGMPISSWQFDYLQVTGVIGFGVLAILGLYGDKFLNKTVRAIINEWAGK